MDVSENCGQTHVREAERNRFGACGYACESMQGRGHVCQVRLDALDMQSSRGVDPGQGGGELYDVLAK